MNNIEVKVCKKLPKEAAEKYEGAESFINNRTDEICSQEKFSAAEVIYFLISFLQFMFPCKLFSSKIVP